MPSSRPAAVRALPPGAQVVVHPLIQHKLAIMRCKRTEPKGFRDLLEEISMLMAFEVTRGLPTAAVDVATPVARAKARRIAGAEPAVVAILRAGLGMVGGILNLIPNAKVGHIGIYRDHKTLQAVQYYENLPADIRDRFVILVDPMLATGHSAIKAVHILKESGARDIVQMSVIAAPEGLAALRRAHPDVRVYVAAVDRKLNAVGYIVPGLGDAGDRLFGTQ